MLYEVITPGEQEEHQDDGPHDERAPPALSGRDRGGAHADPRLAAGLVQARLELAAARLRHPAARSTTQTANTTRISYNFV